MSWFARLLVAGASEQEALENIQDAIVDYLAATIVTIPRHNP